MLKEARLVIADNSGAISARVIECVRRHLYGANGSYGYITMSLKKKSIVAKKLRGSVHIGVPLTLTSKIYRRNGSTLVFGQNRVVVVKDYERFMGSRIRGPAIKDIRRVKIVRIRKAIHYYI